MHRGILSLISLLLVLPTVYGQISRGWSITRDFPFEAGATVGASGTINSVSHDSANNVYLWFERNGFPAWAKYDQFGNLIRTRIEFGWHGIGGASLDDADVNAVGRSAILGGDFVYAYDANGNRLWWRHLPSLVPTARAVCVHVTPGGRVVVGGSLGPDNNSRPAIFAFTAVGSLLYTAAVDVAGNPTRDGEVRDLVADTSERVMFGGVNRIGTSVGGQIGSIAPDGTLLWQAHAVFGGRAGTRVDRVALVEPDSFAYGGVSRSPAMSGDTESVIIGIWNRNTMTEVRRILQGTIANPNSVADLKPADSATEVFASGRATGNPFFWRTESWYTGPADSSYDFRWFAITPSSLSARMAYVQSRRQAGNLVSGQLQRFLMNSSRLDPIPSTLHPDPGGVDVDARGIVHEVYNGVDDSGNPDGSAIMRRIVGGNRIAWVQSLQGASPGMDVGQDVQFDGAGNPVVVAASEGEWNQRVVRVLKLDRAGRQLWSSRVDTLGFSATRLVPTDGNDFVAIGNEAEGRLLRAARIDGATGAVEWNRNFRTQFLDRVTFFNLAAARSLGSTIAVAATIDVNGASRSGWSGVLDAANGTLRWSRVFEVDSDNAEWFAVVPMADGGLVVAGQAVQPGGILPTVVRYGPTGSILWTRAYVPAAAANGAWKTAALGPDGHLYLGGGAYPNNTRPALVASYSAAGALRWVRPLQVTGAQIEAISLGFAGNHCVAAFGSFRNAGFARIDRTTGAVAAVRQIPTPGLERLSAMQVSADGSVLLGAEYSVPDVALPSGRTTGVLRLTRWNAANVASPTLSIPAGVLGSPIRLNEVRRNSFGEWIAVGRIAVPERGSDVMVLQFR